VLPFAAAGCAAPLRAFVNPQADMTLYQNVVIVPFTNLSTDPYAGGRLTRAFTTELVIADRFKLVDPALLLGELDRLNARADMQGQFEPAKLKEAATAIQATAYIRGAVTEYSMHRNGTDEYPVVSFDAEMVDTATGSIVWRITLTRTGHGRMPIFGGLGERSFGRVTQVACQRAVQELRHLAF
jgi:hypothetical protein